MKYNGKELNYKVIQFLEESEREHPIMDAICNFFGKFLPKKAKAAAEAVDNFLKDNPEENLDIVTIHFQDSFITFSRW